MEWASITELPATIEQYQRMRVLKNITKRRAEKKLH